MAFNKVFLAVVVMYCVNIVQVMGTNRLGLHIDHNGCNNAAGYLWCNALNRCERFANCVNVTDVYV